MSKNWRHSCLASTGTLLELLCLVVLLLTCLPVPGSFAQSPKEVEIFVTSSGVHTSIVVPVRTPLIDWRQKLPLQQFATADSSFTYISFSWGDRRFFLETPGWPDLKPWVAISAAFWPTPTAMHVAYIPAKPALNKHQRHLLISLEQYQQLILYIEGSFQQRQKQFELIAGAGYSGSDNFYEAKGKYNILKNCNSWVNNGLKVMGAEAAIWAPLPFAVMRHLPGAQKDKAPVTAGALIMK